MIVRFLLSTEGTLILNLKTIQMFPGNNAYFCERCDKKVNTVKRLCFQKLPNVLAIQVRV